MENLTVKSIRISRAVSPNSRKVSDSTHTIEEIGFLVCDVTLSSGVMGQSYLLSFRYSPEGILGAIRDVATFLEGIPPWETGIFRAKFRAASEYFGVAGLQQQAFALLEMALWDSWARSLDIPIWRLFGTHHKKIPVYGSGGWLSYDLGELRSEVRDYVARGFRVIKIKVGSSEFEADVERVAKVRELVGREIGLLIDGNQGYQTPDALHLACLLAPYDVKLFEEPVANTNFRGFQTVRSIGGLPVSMGEREYDTTALRELAALNAIDLWQPDIIRIGGVAAWRESAALAMGMDVPVLPHYYKDYDVPLLCGIDQARGAESFDWIDGLIDEPLEIEDGWAYPRLSSGWGFRFREEGLSHVWELEL